MDESESRSVCPTGFGLHNLAIRRDPASHPRSEPSCDNAVCGDLCPRYWATDTSTATRTEFSSKQLRLFRGRMCGFGKLNFKTGVRVEDGETIYAPIRSVITRYPKLAHYPLARWYLHRLFKSVVSVLFESSFIQKHQLTGPDERVVRSGGVLQDVCKANRVGRRRPPTNAVHNVVK